jgi:uncharacterized protein
MKYLLDANVFIEFLLEQEKSDEAGELLAEMSRQFSISLLALYSIGIILTRRGSSSAFLELLDDIERTGVVVIQLALVEMSLVIATMQKHMLDFDDAYQYVVAEKYNLTIVSYDADFNRTPRGCTTPHLLLHKLAQENQASDSEVTL